MRNPARAPEEERALPRKRLQIGPEMDDMFLEFPPYSPLSRFAGTYHKAEGETRYGQPVWRRAGVAKQRARLYLDFDVESESWGFVAELEGDARPGIVKATCKASDPLPAWDDPALDVRKSYFRRGQFVAQAGTGRLTTRLPEFPATVVVSMQRRLRTTAQYSDKNGKHTAPAIHSMREEELIQLNGELCGVL